VTARTQVFRLDTSDLDDVRGLLREYAASLAFDLDFQGFDRELAGLPGAYDAPHGALLGARAGGTLAGCVALRRIDDERGELKRLYVRPDERRTGLGLALAEAAIDEARRLGYRRILLDTTPGMEKAQALYERLGFVDTEPYTQNPVPGTRFLALEL
jgi:GNAT superfamily N-acetyltransferase